MASALLESLLGERREDASPAQRSAIEALLRDGLPVARDEPWKYTSLRALDQRRFADGDTQAHARDINAEAFALPGIDGPRLVFVNGTYREDLSDSRSLTGLTLSTLGSQDGLAASAPPEVDAGAAARAQAFVRLNTALATDGVLLRVDAGAQVEQPVHLVFIGAPAADADIAWQCRLQVEVGANARVRLVEHYLSTDAGSQLGNLVADYSLDAHARLDLLQVQDANETTVLIRHSRFRLDQEAHLSTHSLEVGAQTMRHDFNVDLAGRAARFESRGVFALHGRQHADTHMEVRHNARDTACEISWRGVADERARGVFHGAIVIAAGADGADANLSNMNLLLSPSAEIDTQPALEIHADEVKAAHGATVGQLDEQALFYLRSRGIPADAARRILVSAFCGAVLGEVEPAPLRDRLAALLASRLPLAVEG